MATRGHSELVQQAAWDTEQLFAEHFSSLIGYLRGSLRNVPDLEDIAQEAFIRYFKARCNGESINNPKGWLFRVARHLALDQIKRAKPVLLDDAGWSMAEAKHAYQPSLDLDERSLRSPNLPWHLLSDAEKECLLLRAEGLTFREVAEVLDVSISTVASYVARAIKKLRKVVATHSETSEPRRTAALR